MDASEQEWSALSGPGKALVVLLGLNVLAFGFEIVSALIGLGTMHHLTHGGEMEPVTAGHLVSLLDLAGMVAGLAYIPCVIAFLWWFNTRFKRLKQLGVEGVEHTSKQAVYLFFIPFVNFYAPLRVAQEMWRASDPARSSYQPKDRTNESRWIRYWWLAFVIYGFANYATLRLMLAYSNAMAMVTTMQDLVGEAVVINPAFWGTLVSDPLGILAAALAIKMVLSLEARQREKATVVAQAA